MRVLVVDGQLFGTDSDSWVTYQLLYDHHFRPMLPVDDQYNGLEGSELYLHRPRLFDADRRGTAH